MTRSTRAPGSRAMAALPALVAVMTRAAAHDEPQLGPETTLLSGKLLPTTVLVRGSGQVQGSGAAGPSQGRGRRTGASRRPLTGRGAPRSKVISLRSTICAGVSPARASLTSCSSAAVAAAGLGVFGGLDECVARFKVDLLPEAAWRGEKV